MRHILAAAALVLAASSALANHEVEHAFQQGIPADGIRRVVIDIPAGDVTTNLGHEIIERSGLFPGTTRWEKDSGTSRLKLHVTAGDIDVKLTQ